MRTIIKRGISLTAILKTFSVIVSQEGNQTTGLMIKSQMAINIRNVIITKKDILKNPKNKTIKILKNPLIIPIF